MHQHGDALHRHCTAPVHLQLELEFTRLLRVGFLWNCRQPQEKILFCNPRSMPFAGAAVLFQKRIVTPQDGWFQSIIIRQSWPSGRAGGGRS